MIRSYKIEKHRHIYCHSCLRTNIDLIVISAFHKEDFNNYRIDLCKDCYSKLKESIDKDKYESND